jgi:hypothetical protein
LRPDDETMPMRDAKDRLEVIATSFKRLTGRSLIPDDSDVVTALWHAPCAIVAHGNEPDPVFFYGNRVALELFECTIAQFTCMPSRLSAEPLLREERARLLASVTERGYFEDYAGVRISRNGKRFQIEQAVVWNLLDATGRIHGQAATFTAFITGGGMSIMMKPYAIKD